MLNRVFILIAVPILMNCKRQDKSQSNVLSEARPSLNYGVDSLTNSKIISIVKEYIEDNQDGIPKVYTLVTQRSDLLTSSISLCSITTYSELFKSIPSAYFKIDGNIVLVYTGLEYFNKVDSTFITSLEKAIGNRIEDDLLPDRKV